MLVYFDTSALVKRYFLEADSQVVLDLWSRASLITSSQLLYAETAATFARKRRENGPTEALAQAQATFRTDWSSLVRIPIDDDVHRRVDDLLARHALRGADAVHLASAILARDLLQEPLTFACADAALVKAAQAEGLLVSP